MHPFQSEMLADAIEMDRRRDAAVAWMTAGSPPASPAWRRRAGDGAVWAGAALARAGRRLQGAAPCDAPTGIVAGR